MARYIRKHACRWWWCFQNRLLGVNKTKQVRRPVLVAGLEGGEGVDAAEEVEDVDFFVFPLSVKGKHSIYDKNLWWNTFCSIPAVSRDERRAPRALEKEASWNISAPALRPTKDANSPMHYYKSKKKQKINQNQPELIFCCVCSLEAEEGGKMSLSKG